MDKICWSCARYLTWNQRWQTTAVTRNVALVPLRLPTPHDPQGAIDMHGVDIPRPSLNPTRQVLPQAPYMPPNGVGTHGLDRTRVEAAAQAQLLSNHLGSEATSKGGRGTGSLLQPNKPVITGNLPQAMAPRSNEVVGREGPRGPSTLRNVDLKVAQVPSVETAIHQFALDTRGRADKALSNPFPHIQQHDRESLLSPQAKLTQRGADASSALHRPTPTARVQRSEPSPPFQNQSRPIRVAGSSGGIRDGRMNAAMPATTPSIESPAPAAMHPPDTSRSRDEISCMIHLYRMRGYPESTILQHVMASFGSRDQQRPRNLSGAVLC